MIPWLIRGQQQEQKGGTETEGVQDQRLVEEGPEGGRQPRTRQWEDEDENVFVSSVDIKPDDEVVRYSVTVSPEFFVDGTEVKFEVLAREASFNQTAVESCPFEFVLP